MLRAYRAENGTVAPVEAGALETALWIDLLDPTEDEHDKVCAVTGEIDLPDLDDMQEIEVSNRLYRRKGFDVITVMLPFVSDDGHRKAEPVSFVLQPERVITVRYTDPRPFQTYPLRAAETGIDTARAQGILLGLMDEAVARIADLLEISGRDMDTVSHEVLGIGSAVESGRLRGATDLGHALDRIAREGDNIGRLRLCLLTLERGIGFFNQSLSLPGREAEAGPLKPVVKTLMADVHALTEHADFLASKVSLVMNATLGMIDLAQNATVRIVSVVAALFLPPTLIASIYGMNFARMPELGQSWGYPMALGLMVLSALLTFLFFKWRRWL